VTSAEAAQLSTAFSIPITNCPENQHNLEDRGCGHVMVRSHENVQRNAKSNDATDPRGRSSWVITLRYGKHCPELEMRPTVHLPGKVPYGRQGMDMTYAEGAVSFPGTRTTTAFCNFLSWSRQISRSSGMGSVKGHPNAAAIQGYSFYSVQPPAFLCCLRHSCTVPPSTNTQQIPGITSA